MTDRLIVFTPSGRRGRVAEGTTVLDAARALGVDLDSVCAARGICGRCQVDVAEGEFQKHGIASRAASLSAWTGVEQRYADVRGALKSGRRLGCQAHIVADVVVDVPPESQVHRQVIRKAADLRPIALDPVVHLRYVEVAGPDMHDPASDFRRLKAALRDQWQVDDARASLPYRPVFDAVVLDAPCSGLGTLRRDPDLKWSRTEGDLPALAAAERLMLEQAAGVVGPGGRLVYATCSSEPDENEAVAEAFLTGHPEFLPVPVCLDGPAAALVNARGHLVTLPFRDGLDAFFAAIFVRGYGA